jgi:hypothetical protein
MTMYRGIWSSSAVAQRGAPDRALQAREWNVCRQACQGLGAGGRRVYEVRARRFHPSVVS